MEYEIITFKHGNETELISSDQVESKVEEIFEFDFAEVWLEGHGTTSLCLLLNPTSVFLMYLRTETDSGFRLENGNPDQATKDFKLTNGQVDSYPLSWLASREEGKNAVSHYCKTGKMYDKLNWIEE